MRRRKPTGKSLAAITALLITLAITFIGSSVSAMELTTSERTEATTQQAETQETVIHEDAVSFTPDGNLTLIDDFIRTDESDKQFITVKTRDESVFYIVIDRSANQENVYFLNLVDDQDLIAILNDEGLTEEIETITKLPDSQESEQAKPSPTKPETTDPDSSPTAMQLVVILVFVAAIGGAAFWLIRSQHITISPGNLPGVNEQSIARNHLNNEHKKQYQNWCNHGHKDRAAIGVKIARLWAKIIHLWSM